MLLAVREEYSLECLISLCNLYSEKLLQATSTVLHFIAAFVQSKMAEKLFWPPEGVAAKRRVDRLSDDGFRLVFNFLKFSANFYSASGARGRRGCKVTSSLKCLTTILCQCSVAVF